jgi:hypothetical protein
MDTDQICWHHTIRRQPHWGRILTSSHPWSMSLIWGGEQFNRSVQRLNPGPRGSDSRLRDFWNFPELIRVRGSEKYAKLNFGNKTWWCMNTPDFNPLARLTFGRSSLFEIGSGHHFFFLNFPFTRRSTTVILAIWNTCCP